MSNEAVITIILTIIFGVPSLVALFQSFPSKIILVIDEKLDVYEKINGTFKDLEVTYKGERIEKNYFLFKGCFFYRGKADIEKDQIKFSTYIEIPPKSIWYDFKIIESSKDLVILPTVEEGKLYFNFDLLKNGDYYYFQAFAKIEEQKKDDDNFVPNHRIANVAKKIDTIDYGSVSKSKQNAIGFCFVTITVLFLGLFMAKEDLEYIGSFSDNVETTYFYKGKIIPKDYLRKIYFKDFGKSLSLDTHEIFEKEVKKDYTLKDYFLGKDVSIIKMRDGIEVKFKVFTVTSLLFYANVILFITLIILTSLYSFQSYKYGEIINRIQEIKSRT